MKDLAVLSFCAFIAVVRSKELNSTLQGQLYGKVIDGYNNLLSAQSVLYSLVRVVYPYGTQTGFYGYSSQVVYIQHPIGYRCNLVGVQNINFTGAKIYRSNDGPYKVRTSSPLGRYIFLQLETQPPERDRDLSMLIMAVTIESKTGQDAYIAGWNEDNRPVILLVKISHVASDEIHVDLSSHKVVEGNDYISSNEIKRGDLLIQSYFCVGFFIRRLGSIGVFSVIYLSEYIPVRQKRPRTESSLEVERSIKQITTDVRDFNLGN